MENTLNEIEAAYHAPDCDESRKARMTAYRRAKRQLTSCQFPATKELFEALKPQTENDHDTLLPDESIDKNSYENMSMG